MTPAQLDAEIAAIRSLHEWARHTGEAGYLDDALTRAQRVADFLASTGLRLHQRYLATGRVGDLDEAVAVAGQAVVAAPLGHPARSFSTTWPTSSPNATGSPVTHRSWLRPSRSCGGCRGSRVEPARPGHGPEQPGRPPGTGSGGGPSR